MLNNKNQDFHNARKLALTKAFPVMLGIAFLGVGYGVYMRSCGFDMIWPICMAEKYRGMGRKKLWAVSGLIDEAFSLNYMTDVPPGTDRNWFMLFVSLYLYISWIGGTVVGAVSACKAVVDIKGVGFVMTALFIVIFISQWQKERTHGSSILGLVVAGGCLLLFGKTYFMLPTILIITTIFTVRWLTTKDKEKLV